MTTPAHVLHVLFADDEAEVREYFEEMLQRLGHRVTLADSGQQLVSLSREHPPDLIITDLMMPDMDGLEAAMEANREREVPIIVVSAHNDPAVLSRPGSEQVMAYLVKPVKEADVQTAIAVALVRFEQMQQLQQEARDLRQSLEDRKLLERAKGAVMKRLRVDEQEAFRKMKRLASDRNRKLTEVAQSILTAEEVFVQLDRT
jgi:AmiR/NasT family two-component response regulator